MEILLNFSNKNQTYSKKLNFKINKIQDKI